MSHATVTADTSPLPADTSIVAAEAAHFGKLAAEWWDPKGSSAMLHRLNPVRLGYIRAAVDRHVRVAGGGRPDSAPASLEAK